MWKWPQRGWGNSGVPWVYPDRKTSILGKWEGSEIWARQFKCDVEREAVLYFVIMVALKDSH